MTWASLTGGPPPREGADRQTSSRHRVRRPLPARTEDFRQCPLDLVGQVRDSGFMSGRSVNGFGWVPDCAAVPALDFAEPPDQMHTGAHLAPV
jgi:hypothetical protein